MKRSSGTFALFHYYMKIATTPVSIFVHEQPTLCSLSIQTPAECHGFSLECKFRSARDWKEVSFRTEETVGKKQDVIMLENGSCTMYKNKKRF